MVRIRRTFGDALISVGALVALVLMLAAFDGRVREQISLRLGSGRANNLLRHLFALPAKEPGAVPVAFSRERPEAMLRERIDPSKTVVLTCGNPNGMADIAWIASQARMRFEKEDW